MVPPRLAWRCLGLQIPLFLPLICIVGGASSATVKAKSIDKETPFQPDNTTPPFINIGDQVHSFTTKRFYTDQTVKNIRQVRRQQLPVKNSKKVVINSSGEVSSLTSSQPKVLQYSLQDYNNGVETNEKDTFNYLSKYNNHRKVRDATLSPSLFTWTWLGENDETRKEVTTHLHPEVSHAETYPIRVVRPRPTFFPALHNAYTNSATHRNHYNAWSHGIENTTNFNKNTIGKNSDSDSSDELTELRNSHLVGQDSLTIQRQEQSEQHHQENGDKELISSYKNKTGSLLTSLIKTNIDQGFHYFTRDYEADEIQNKFEESKTSNLRMDHQENSTDHWDTTTETTAKEGVVVSHSLNFETNEKVKKYYTENAEDISVDQYFVTNLGHITQSKETQTSSPNTHKMVTFTDSNYGPLFYTAPYKNTPMFNEPGTITPPGRPVYFMSNKANDIKQDQSTYLMSGHLVSDISEEAYEKIEESLRHDNKIPPSSTSTPPAHLHMPVLGFREVMQYFHNLTTASPYKATEEPETIHGSISSKLTVSTDAQNQSLYSSDHDLLHEFLESPSIISEVGGAVSMDRDKVFKESALKILDQLGSNLKLNNTKTYTSDIKNTDSLTVQEDILDKISEQLFTVDQPSSVSNQDLLINNIPTKEPENHSTGAIRDSSGEHIYEMSPVIYSGSSYYATTYSVPLLPVISRNFSTTEDPKQTTDHLELLYQDNGESIKTHIPVFHGKPTDNDKSETDVTTTSYYDYGYNPVNHSQSLISIHAPDILDDNEQPIRATWPSIISINQPFSSHDITVTDNPTYYIPVSSSVQMSNMSGFLNKNPHEYSTTIKATIQDSTHTLSDLSHNREESPSRNASATEAGPSEDLATSSSFINDYMNYLLNFKVIPKIETNVENSNIYSPHNLSSVSTSHNNTQNTFPEHYILPFLDIQDTQVIQNTSDAEKQVIDYEIPYGYITTSTLNLYEQGNFDQYNNIPFISTNADDKKVPTYDELGLDMNRTQDQSVTTSLSTPLVVAANENTEAQSTSTENLATALEKFHYEQIPLITLAPSTSHDGNIHTESTGSSATTESPVTNNIQSTTKSYFECKELESLSPLIQFYSFLLPAMKNICKYFPTEESKRDEINATMQETTEKIHKNHPTTMEPENSTFEDTKETSIFDSISSLLNTDDKKILKNKYELANPNVSSTENDTITTDISSSLDSILQRYSNITSNLSYITPINLFAQSTPKSNTPLNFNTSDIPLLETQLDKYWEPLRHITAPPVLRNITLMLGLNSPTTKGESPVYLTTEETDYQQMLKSVLSKFAHKTPKQSYPPEQQTNVTKSNSYRDIILSTDDTSPFSKSIASLPEAMILESTPLDEPDDLAEFNQTVSSSTALHNSRPTLKISSSYVQTDAPDYHNNFERLQILQENEVNNITNVTDLGSHTSAESQNTRQGLWNSFTTPKIQKISFNNSIQRKEPTAQLDNMESSYIESTLVSPSLSTENNVMETTTDITDFSSSINPSGTVTEPMYNTTYYNAGLTVSNNKGSLQGNESYSLSKITDNPTTTESVWDSLYRQWITRSQSRPSTTRFFPKIIGISPNLSAIGKPSPSNPTTPTLKPITKKSTSIMASTPIPEITLYESTIPISMADEAEITFLRKHDAPDQETTTDKNFEGVLGSLWEMMKKKEDSAIEDTQTLKIFDRLESITLKNHTRDTTTGIPLYTIQNISAITASSSSDETRSTNSSPPKMGDYLSTKSKSYSNVENLFTVSDFDASQTAVTNMPSDSKKIQRRPESIYSSKANDTASKDLPSTGSSLDSNYHPNINVADTNRASENDQNDIPNRSSGIAPIRSFVRKITDQILGIPKSPNNENNPERRKVSSQSPVPRNRNNKHKTKEYTEYSTRYLRPNQRITSSGQRYWTTTPILSQSSRLLPESDSHLLYNHRPYDTYTTLQPSNRPVIIVKKKGNRYHIPVMPSADFSSFKSYTPTPDPAPGKERLTTFEPEIKTRPTSPSQFYNRMGVLPTTNIFTKSAELEFNNMDYVDQHYTSTFSPTPLNRNKFKDSKTIPSEVNSIRRKGCGAAILDRLEYLLGRELVMDQMGIGVYSAVVESMLNADCGPPGNHLDTQESENMFATLSRPPNDLGTRQVTTIEPKTFQTSTSPRYKSRDYTPPSYPKYQISPPPSTTSVSPTMGMEGWLTLDDLHEQERKDKEATEALFSRNPFLRNHKLTDEVLTLSPIAEYLLELPSPLPLVKLDTSSSEAPSSSISLTEGTVPHTSMQSTSVPHTSLKQSTPVPHTSPMQSIPVPHTSPLQSTPVPHTSPMQSTPVPHTSPMQSTVSSSGVDSSSGENTSSNVKGHSSSSSFEYYDTTTSFSSPSPFYFPTTTQVSTLTAQTDESNIFPKSSSKSESITAALHTSLKTDPSTTSVTPSKSLGDLSALSNSLKTDPSTISVTPSESLGDLSTLYNSLKTDPSTTSVAPSESLEDLSALYNSLKTDTSTTSVTPSESLGDLFALSNSLKTDSVTTSVTPSESLGILSTLSNSLKTDPSNTSVTPSESLGDLSALYNSLKTDPDNTSVTPSESLGDLSALFDSLKTDPVTTSITPSESLGDLSALSDSIKTDPDTTTVTPSESLGDLFASPNSTASSNSTHVKRSITRQLPSTKSNSHLLRRAAIGFAVLNSLASAAGE
ncbi:hypothetical protein SK128_001357 [Halocaridina rubra]|uniref:Uncharacterized protein n=1 Tax=Halocaridina rubra TaxID=373956 RepID=A0AAN9ACD0_HALRR